MKYPFVLLIAFVLCAMQAQSAPPVVSNIRASQRSGAKLVDIYYDLSASSSSLTVAAQISSDGGLTYTLPAVSLSGAVGAGVSPGTGKHVVWNAGADWNGQWVPNCAVRILANDGTTPAPPAGMAYIPGGPFQMGDNLDGISDAMPVHSVQISAFFMDINLVSGAVWQNAQSWANGNGYSIGSGIWYANSHPVIGVNWYDCIKWCNARSEKEGLTPVYYTDDAQTQVYRTGYTNVTNVQVKWDANGYRLPTEAEWEKAARGGLLGQRYPWGNECDGNKANYYGSGDPWDSADYMHTTPCGYYNGGQTPSGMDMANGYGLYDMAGNVWQWCWDWYGSGFYADASAANEPRGPMTGSVRIMRGGCSAYSAFWIRCALRNSYSPSSGDYINGFRCVKGL